MDPVINQVLAAASGTLPDWGQWLLLGAAILGSIGAFIGLVVMTLKLARVLFRIEEALPILLITAERLQKEDLWLRLDNQDRQVAGLDAHVSELEKQVGQIQASNSARIAQLETTITQIQAAGGVAAMVTVTPVPPALPPT